MEVSDEVLKGLEICKNLSDEVFQSLIEQAFKSLNSKDELSELISNSKESENLKQGHSSIVSLALLFTKLDVTIDEIKEYLTEQSVPTSKVTIFANNYNSNQDSLKYSLASMGFYFPHIVDVSWRADFNTKSNETQDQIKSDAIPKIYIKFTCEQDSKTKKTKDIDFRCTIEQLQDLVGKLKDASASLDRLDMYQTES